MNTKTKIFFITVLTVLFILISYFVFIDKNDSETEYTMNGAPTEYLPPTEEEIKAGDEIKDKQVTADELNASSQDDSSATTTVTPVVISDASQYDSMVEIRAFMPEVVQKGSCIIRLTKGQLLIEKTAEAFADASSTICTNQELSTSDFPESGGWNVVVEYSSRSYKGVSEARTLEISK